MKLKLFLVLLWITVAFISCKKDDAKEPGTAKKVVVTTIAGDGTSGFSDGPALSAKFNTPADVVVAPDGSIYVTDADNSRIRKIMEGQVSTFAGNGIRGIVNGNGTSAQFGYPYSIALDANGNLYTSDLDDYRIRIISPRADVADYDINSYDFPGLFIAVQGMVVDAQGNIYVADTYNQRIRKISVSRQVTTLAGGDNAGFRDGSGAEARFNHPSGIAIDKQGNLYVPDPYNFRIRKITPDGQVSTFAGSGIFGHKDGDAGIARFRFPVDIVIDSKENLFIADNNSIRKISPQGVVSTFAGSDRGYADGNGATAKFFDPLGLAIDARDNIYVADTYNNRIRKISLE
jgi:sugar lactone lactonase YvrE